MQVSGGRLCQAERTANVKTERDKEDSIAGQNPENKGENHQDVGSEPSLGAHYHTGHCKDLGFILSEMERYDRVLIDHF